MAQMKPKKIVFMFLGRGADPTKHRATLSLDSMELIVVGVPSYDQAVKVSKELVKEGVSVFELCGGFGNIGVGKIAEAVKGVPIGVVRFDMHPAAQGKTGDQKAGLTP